MRVIQPSSKRIGRFLEVPNLIELQLNSYKWFLEEGLPELFQTFSPIWDFTQTNYIELVSFTLGEPKYSISECRDRDMTFEGPIKAIVRFGGRDREVIESEVYLGDLPLMTDKGTFIINGRERVIVSQLSRSPGLYFEEGVDSSMQVLVSARIIPNEGVRFPPPFDYAVATIAVENLVLRFIRGLGEVGVFVAPASAPSDWHDL